MLINVKSDLVVDDRSHAIMMVSMYGRVFFATGGSENMRSSFCRLMHLSLRSTGMPRPSVAYSSGKVAAMRSLSIFC